MKHTKNQKRMEKISRITREIDDLHKEVWAQRPLTRPELVGLNVEINDLLMAVESLHRACVYAPKG
jgi:hypothetical protein